MVRLIAFINKPCTSKTYICDGRGCQHCMIRFECFTIKEGEVFLVDWENDLVRSIKSSPARKLKALTGSKVYVRGSKKFEALKEKNARHREEI